MVEILNAHGSKNDIFVAAMRPRDFAAEPDLLAFVRACATGTAARRGRRLFLRRRPRVPQAWFFNRRLAAEFCGNGMRCLGRVILDLRGATWPPCAAASVSTRCAAARPRRKASARSASSTRRSTSIRPNPWWPAGTR